MPPRATRGQNQNPTFLGFLAVLGHESKIQLKNKIQLRNKIGKIAKILLDEANDFSCATTDVLAFKIRAP